jgi:hypothetical protein
MPGIFFIVDFLLDGEFGRSILSKGQLVVKRFHYLSLNGPVLVWYLKCKGKLMANVIHDGSAGHVENRSKEQTAKLGFIRDLVIFWFVIFLVVLCWTNNIMVTAILIGAYGLRSYLWPNKEDHVLFVGGAILGPIAEIIATSVGIWQYTIPTFFNIPLWLPFAWGFATVLIIRIALAFVKKQ